MKPVLGLILGACLLSASPIDMGGVPRARAMVMGENATHCIDLVGYNIHNQCNYTVEVVWCVENYDCNGGRFTNMKTLQADGHYPANGSNTGNTVHWGACRGANTLNTLNTQPYSYRFNCE